MMEKSYLFDEEWEAVESFSSLIEAVGVRSILLSSSFSRLAQF